MSFTDSDLLYGGILSDKFDCSYKYSYITIAHTWRDRLRRDRMVVGFAPTCAISAYHHEMCEFEPSSWRSELDATLFDNV